MNSQKTMLVSSLLDDAAVCIGIDVYSLIRQLLLLLLLVQHDD